MKKQKLPIIRWEKVEKIKKQFKDGTYDWKKAIEGTAEKILQYPETLLWR